MRTLFIGGTKRGYLTLEALVRSGASVSGVISLRQDEHERDRFEEPIRELAAGHGIPLWETKWLKDRDYISIVRDEIRPDIAFVVGCRILIPEALYGLPRLGSLAVHDSMLPEYRGFAPLNWAILNGEDHTGVTLFYLSEKMDGGDIVAQRRVPIGPHDTAPEVYERVCRTTIDVILDSYSQLEAGTAPRRVQDYSEGTFTCSRGPADGEIDWSRPTASIYNQVRALASPYPGAYTFFEGRKLTVWSARPKEGAPRFAGRIPGRVTGRSDEGVEVLTGDGVLIVSEVQLEGAEPSSAASVLRSVRITLGLRTSDLLERIRQLERQLEAAGSAGAI